MSALGKEIAEAVATAIAKYAVAYEHVTLADMSTSGRQWHVHEVKGGNPFDDAEWIETFDNKDAANKFCASLREASAIAAADAAIAPLVEALAALVQAADAMALATNCGMADDDINKAEAILARATGDA